MNLQLPTVTTPTPSASTATWLDRLLSLGNLSASSEDVSPRFAMEPPLWAWVLIILGAGALAWWSYWRLTGALWSRLALASLRALLLILIAVLIAGPQLVKENPRTENDAVVVMLDRSASMTVADAPRSDSDRTTTTLQTRNEQLQQALAAAWPALREMATQREVILLGFDDRTREITPPTDGSAPTTALGEPTGARTLLGQGLEAALKRASTRPLAGVIILSDGRSADTPSRGLLAQLEARQTPVFVAPLGSAIPLPDVAIARIEAPAAAFLGDQVPIVVDVERRGSDSDDSDDNTDISTTGGTLQLIDEATGLILSEVPLTGNSGGRYTLMTSADASGPARWSVRLALPRPDLSLENNTAPVRIDLVDRPIRVVYIDGYPRWEYRYLKNLLLRERSIRSSTWILSADKRFLQEGSEPLQSVPRTREDWAGIDVVILGDLRPGLFGQEQLESLRWLVSQRGAGLMLIGGPGAMPAAWRESPIADLIPFAIPSGSTELERFGAPVIMAPAPGAQRLGVLMLGPGPQDPWPAALADPSLGWPRLQWAQRIDTAWLKPTAEVLAEARPADSPDSPGQPLVMTMRYGAGRSLFVGTDETWRYRFGRGETLPERFWIPLIRLLARESLARGGNQALLEASPDRARVDQSVRISLRLLDQNLVAAAQGQSVQVRVSRIGTAGRGTDNGEIITLAPEAAREGESQSASFARSWTGLEPGIYSVDPVSPWLTGLTGPAGAQAISARIEIALPEDELRFPQADHAALLSLASSTGGRAIEPSRLTDILSELPNRRVTLLGTPDIETLWDTPLALALLLLLASAEWVGRRLIKLS